MFYVKELHHLIKMQLSTLRNMLSQNLFLFLNIARNQQVHDLLKLNILDQLNSKNLINGSRIYLIRDKTLFFLELGSENN